MGAEYLIVLPAEGQPQEKELAQNAEKTEIDVAIGNEIRIGGNAFGKIPASDHKVDVFRNSGEETTENAAASVEEIMGVGKIEIARKKSCGDMKNTVIKTDEYEGSLVETQKFCKVEDARKQKHTGQNRFEKVSEQIHPVAIVEVKQDIGQKKYRGFMGRKQVVHKKDESCGEKIEDVFLVDGQDEKRECGDEFVIFD